MPGLFRHQRAANCNFPSSPEVTRKEGMARATEAAPSPPEAVCRGCHSPVTRPWLCPTRFLPNYRQALRAGRGRRRAEGKASGAVSQGNLSPEPSSSPRWDAGSASLLEASRPASRALLPALRPSGDGRPTGTAAPGLKQDPEPRPGGEMGSKEERRHSSVPRAGGCAAAQRPPAHAQVSAAPAEQRATQEAFSFPPPRVQDQAAQCTTPFSSQPLSEARQRPAYFTAGEGKPCGALTHR